MKYFNIQLNNIICIILYLFIVAEELLANQHKPLLNIFIGTILILSSLPRIKVDSLKLTWPLFVILSLGTIGSSGHELRDIVRDIVYAINPIMLIYIGYWLGGRRKMEPLFFKTLLYGAVTIAAIHLFKFSLNPEIITLSVNKIREEIGGGSSLVALVFVLSFYEKKLNTGAFSGMSIYRYVIIMIFVASITLSFSRTDDAIIIIIMLTIRGIYNKSTIVLILLLAIISIYFVGNSELNYNTDSTNFVGKTARSFSEISITDYTSKTDIHANWRGYETYRAVVTYLESSFIQKITGLGFGSLIDLGFFISLGWTDYRYIPILHNGYAYILVKTGALGIIMYMIFYANMIRIGIRNINSNVLYLNVYSRLLTGCIMSLVFVMFVSGGMAECSTPAIVMLVGYLVKKLNYSTTVKFTDK